jgi:hypothetical protein
MIARQPRLRVEYPKCNNFLLIGMTNEVPENVIEKLVTKHHDVDAKTAPWYCTNPRVDPLRHHLLEEHWIDEEAGSLGMNHCGKEEGRVRPVK